MCPLPPLFGINLLQIVTLSPQKAVFRHTLVYQEIRNLASTTISITYKQNISFYDIPPQAE